jgi:hypothetical protein
MDTDQVTPAELVPILTWVDQDANRYHRINRHFWTFWFIFWQSRWTKQNRGRFSVTQRWSFCCLIPWSRNIWQRISVRLLPWLAGNVEWRYDGKIHNYRNIRWICFGFYFGVVIYLGHTIAQYKNIFDIADIYGDRRGVRTFWISYISFISSLDRSLILISGLMKVMAPPDSRQLLMQFPLS